MRATRVDKSGGSKINYVSQEISPRGNSWAHVSAMCVAGKEETGDGGGK